jgi:hypothetical protein
MTAGGNLTDGHTLSCGCWKRERCAAAGRKAKRHGHAVHGAQSRTYRSWWAMRQRCLNPGHQAFKHYGGRGIAVCERWDSFEAFLADMGERPVGMSLDRIDNDGGYEPGNCRWATPQTQASNTRMTRYLTVRGVSLPVAEWLRRSGVNRSTYRSRLRRGWSEDRAVEAASDDGDDDDRAYDDMRDRRAERGM